MNRLPLVIIFTILGLLLILSVVNAIAFRRIDTANGQTIFWLNVLAALILVIAIIWVVYEITRQKSETSQT